MSDKKIIVIPFYWTYASISTFFIVGGSHTFMYYNHASGFGFIASGVYWAYCSHKEYKNNTLL